MLPGKGIRVTLEGTVCQSLRRSPELRAGTWVQSQLRVSSVVFLSPAPSSVQVSSKIEGGEDGKTKKVGFSLNV